MAHQYYAVVQYENSVVFTFNTRDSLEAMAKLSRLIEEEFPHAEGEIIDTLTGKVIYHCHQCAIC